MPPLAQHLRHPPCCDTDKPGSTMPTEPYRECRSVTRSSVRCGVFARFHVHAHETPPGRAARHTSCSTLARHSVVGEIQAELRQFQRDVALDTGFADGRQGAQVDVAGGGGFGQRVTLSPRQSRVTVIPSCSGAGRPPAPLPGCLRPQTGPPGAGRRLRSPSISAAAFGARGRETGCAPDLQPNTPRVLVDCGVGSQRAEIGRAVRIALSHMPWSGCGGVDASALLG